MSKGKNPKGQMAKEANQIQNNPGDSLGWTKTMEHKQQSGHKTKAAHGLRYTGKDMGWVT